MKNYIFIALCLSASLMVIGVVRSLADNKDPKGTQAIPPTTEKALFAGGCFWCMEKPFEVLDGIITATSGYSGGKTKNPTYQDYGSGGHIEVVQIIFDPQKIITRATHSVTATTETLRDVTLF